MRAFRSWRDITSSDPAEYFGISLNRNHHVAAISEFVRDAARDLSKPLTMICCKAKLGPTS
jgi:hypothetical protein